MEPTFFKANLNYTNIWMCSVVKDSNHRKIQRIKTKSILPPPCWLSQGWMLPTDKCVASSISKTIYKLFKNIFMLKCLKMYPSSSVTEASPVPRTAVSQEASATPQDGSLWQMSLFLPPDKCCVIPACALLRAAMWFTISSRTCWEWRGCCYNYMGMTGSVPGK